MIPLLLSLLAAIGEGYLILSAVCIVALVVILKLPGMVDSSGKFDRVERERKE